MGVFTPKVCRLRKNTETRWMEVLRWVWARPKAPNLSVPARNSNLGNPMESFRDIFRSKLETKVFVETHELGKTARIERALGSPLSGPMKLLLSVIKMSKDYAESGKDPKPWRKYVCVEAEPHLLLLL